MTFDPYSEEHFNRLHRVVDNMTGPLGLVRFAQHTLRKLEVIRNDDTECFSHQQALLAWKDLETSLRAAYASNVWQLAQFDAVYVTLPRSKLKLWFKRLFCRHYSRMTYTIVPGCKNGYDFDLRRCTKCAHEWWPNSEGSYVL